MSWGRMVGATFLTLCALGCAANPRIAEPAAPLPEMTPPAQVESGPTTDAGNDLTTAGVRIESITAQPEDNGTLIVIKGDHPLNYTSYDPDLSTLVLELPGVDVSAVEPTIAVGTPQLARIEVSSLESRSGSKHAHIELVGRTSADTRIEPEGSELRIYLEGTSMASLLSEPAEEPVEEESAMLDPTPEAAPMATPVETAATVAPMPPAAPATTLRAVTVSGDDDAPVVTLEGDGALAYESFELQNPPRLVVDVAGVTNGVRAKSIPVGSEILEQIRVSQFSNEPEKVARVVFDLSRKEAYQIQANGSSVAVSFAGPTQSEPVVASSAMSPGGVEDLPASPPDALTEIPSLQPAEPVSAPKPAPAAALTEIEKPAPARTAPEAVRPASSSLMEAGRDVVLFDNSGGRSSLQSASASRSKDMPAMTTLPQSIFESRTIAGGRRQYRGEKISVAFRDADLREVMFFFADVMKMNVVLDPDVMGKVDIRLNQVPWDQAFQVILKNQGLDATEEDNVIRIAKTTKLRQEASDLRALKQAQEQAVDPVTFTRTLSYAKVQDAMTVLQQVKTDRGKIVADIRTNTLIISDIPDKRMAYDGLLDALDTQTPQVIIEARIVEAQRSYERDLGINWAMAGKADPAHGTATNLQFPHTIDFKADVNTAPQGFPSAGSIGLMLGNVLDSFTLDIALEAFEADGKVRILSSPKIATQNNQPATIEQGVQIPVVTTTATEVDVQYVPASLRLIVTPQITAEDTVIMKLKVENNQPSSTISVADVPGIVTESVDTQILVRTGTTAVIGGVYKLQETENETGIPGLRKIPFFGWLFKNKTNKKDSQELLVFITPKIVKNI